MSEGKVRLSRKVSLRCTPVLRPEAVVQVKPDTGLSKASKARCLLASRSHLATAQEEEHNNKSRTSIKNACTVLEER